MSVLRIQSILRGVPVLLALCAPVAVHGQVADSVRQPVFRVGEISVQAARPVTTAGGASALEVRLDSMGLAPAPTLEQVLRELPLVQVRTNSRGEAQFSLRGSGSDARQVAVLVDGVPLNLGWDDRADLSVLPATAIGNLTLIRGLPSMLHGPNVLGGVVEVGVGHHPGRWMPPRLTELSAGVESTGAFSLAASTALPLELQGGQLAVRAGAGLRERPGFALPARVPQPAPGAGQPIREYDDDLRTNTDLSHRDAFLALRYLAGRGGWGTLTASAFQAERGIASELHVTSPRYWRYPHVARLVGVVSAGTGDRASPFGGHGDLEASVGYDVGRTEIVSYAGPSYTQVTGGEDGDDRTVTLRLMGDQTLGGSGDLRGSFTWVDIRHDEQLAGAAAASTYRQRIWSLGAETVWRVPFAAAFPLLHLSVSGAVDGADTPEAGDKPALGRLNDWGARLGATSASAGGGLLLHAGASRRARFPSLRELYSGALGRFEPNPALRPEVLTAAEAGITTRLPAGELQVVGFYRNLSGAIERITVAGGRFQRVNLGAVRSGGVEVMGSTALGPLALGADLTLQRVRAHGEDGTAEDGHAEYQPGVLGGLNARVQLPFAVRAGASGRYTGVQYCANPDAPGELRLGASTRLDGDVAREFRVRPSGFGRFVELRAAVDNVSDAAIYDQCGLPQPGRTLRLQVRIR